MTGPTDDYPNDVSPGPPTDDLPPGPADDRTWKFPPDAEAHGGQADPPTTTEGTAP